ncbi:uncharacterized protein LOC108673779 isoform X1 [Hyalella azteca]|uniref:Uncharacterized protein LOC108673779 isoform X1 n=1 Tax=Hyalella azteca TaxID=294128 RepID=A0A979FH78_HYAAZ|nr:uncharacterized protein LOC108673779 isoform X1 [Hyalella azteca]
MASTHPLIKFAFSNVSAVDGSLQALCKFCTFGGGLVKFDRTSYSNLSRHLLRHHPDEYIIYCQQTEKSSSLDARGEKMKKSLFLSSTETTPSMSSISSHITKKDIPTTPCNSNISSTMPDLTEAPVPLEMNTNQEEVHPSPTVSFTSPSHIPKQQSYSSVSMNRKIKPILMCKPECKSCNSLENADKFFKLALKVALDECTHKTNDCCCTGKFAKLSGRTEEEKRVVSRHKARTFDGSSFLSQYNSKNDQIVYFCKVCLSRGRLSKGKRKVGESWTEGMTFTTTRKKNIAMKMHLLSQQHKEAMEFTKSDDESQRRLGFPTREEQEKATRNTMIAGIFMTSHSLPFRLYTALCAFLSLICPSHLSNPLGNQHQTHVGIRHVLSANYEACATTMKRFFYSTFAATKSKRKITISCDKGTAPKDVSRQAIVATYVRDDGMPEEMVLGVPMIRQGGAVATTNHVKENVSLFLDPSTVAFVCTDSEAVYTGNESGMIEMLKTSNEFQNLNGLPDFCHKIENLLQRSMPKWVSETLATCKCVSAFVNDYNIVKNIIHKHINLYHGSSFSTIPNQGQTRFAQYLYLHLDAILKNLPIMIEALPELVNTQTFLSDKAIVILKSIIQDSFIIKVMFIRRLYKLISEKEKIAQNTDFGPFQYKHLVDNLASELQELKTPFIDVENFQGKDTVINLMNDNSKWIDQICNEAPNYLMIPQPIALATQLFSLHHRNNLEGNSTAIKQLFNTVNIQFELCGSECKGVEECECLISDYEKFMAIFQSQYQALPNNSIIRPGTSKSQSYTHAFARYIAENNPKNVYPTNIIRCLEIIQLMRPSLAATERVMSHMTSMMSRSESMYDSNKKMTGDSTTIDSFQMEVFLKCNTNIVQHNADLAKQIFLGRHKGSLMKNKKPSERSYTVNNYLDELSRKISYQNLTKRKNAFDQNQEDCKRTRMDFTGPNVLKNYEVPASLNSVLVASTQPINHSPANGTILQHEVVPPLSPLVNKAGDARSIETFDQPNESREFQMGGTSLNLGNETANVKKNRMEVYCICQMKNDKGSQSQIKHSKLIGCSSAQKCESYIERMAEKNVGGGDWFHVECLKMDKIPKGPWYCQKCNEKYAANLRQDLTNYNIQECSIVLQRCAEAADGGILCAKQSLPQLSAGEAKSETLEADAQSPVDNFKDEIEDGTEDVDVKEEPFSYDDKQALEPLNPGCGGLLVPPPSCVPCKREDPKETPVVLDVPLYLLITDGAEGQAGGIAMAPANHDVPQYYLLITDGAEGQSSSGESSIAGGAAAVAGGSGEPSTAGGSAAGAGDHGDVFMSSNPELLPNRLHQFPGGETTFWATNPGP